MRLFIFLSSVTFSVFGAKLPPPVHPQVGSTEGAQSPADNGLLNQLPPALLSQLQQQVQVMTGGPNGPQVLLTSEQQELVQTLLQQVPVPFSKWRGQTDGHGVADVFQFGEYGPFTTEVTTISSESSTTEPSTEAPIDDTVTEAGAIDLDIFP